MGLSLALITLLFSPVGSSQSGSTPRYAGTRAEVIKQTPPKYPRGSKKRGQEGWVMLSFMIRENGRVVEQGTHAALLAMERTYAHLYSEYESA